MKRWKNSFRSENENLNIILTWVHFPQLPIKYYNVNIIARITKGIGELITIDKVTILRNRMAEARICVNINITKELLKEIHIYEEDGGSFLQSILYENLSMQCNLYKQYDHYAREGPKRQTIVQNTNNGNKNSYEWRVVQKKGKISKKEIPTLVIEEPTITIKNPYLSLEIFEGSNTNELHS